MIGPRVSRTFALNVLLAGSAGGSSIIAARALGPDGFGQYALASTVASLGAVLGGLGTGVSLRVQAHERGGTILPAYIRVSLALATGVGLMLALGWFVISGDRAQALIVSGLALCLTISRQGTEGLHAYGRTEAALVVNFLSSATLLASMLILGLLDLLTPPVALAALALSSLFPPTYFYLRTVRGFSTSMEIDQPRSPSRRVALELVKDGLPTLGFTMGQTVLQRADRLLLGWFSGSASVGIYAAATAISETVRLPPQAIGQVAFFRARLSDVSEIRRLRALSIATSACAAGAVISLAPVLVDALFGGEYSAAVTPLRILAAAEFLYALAFVDSRILLSRGDARRVGRQGALVGVFALVTYFALIPTWGAVGAAVASLVSYAAMAASLDRLYRRAPTE